MVAGPRSMRRLLDAVLTIGSELDLPAMLRQIIESAVDLSDATYGALGVLDESGDRLNQFITVGLDDETYRSIGVLPEGHGILGVLIVDAKPLRLPDLAEHPDSYGFPPNHPPMKSFLGVPIRLRDKAYGNLYLTDKKSGEVFTDVDQELVVGLAAAASVAIDNARLHDRLHEMAVSEDRDRIARDLHDLVVQRLFATGLSLQSALGIVRTNLPTAMERISAAIDELDGTVKQIRTTIFGLEESHVAGDGVRSQVLAIAREAASALGFDPRVLLDGPLDTSVDSRVATELLATLREALANVARHARASRVEVEVAVVAAGDVLIRVVDDGIGPGHADRRGGKGLPNMAARAASLGGTTDIRPGDLSGTVFEWRVPKG